jgi:uracil-DNA glycosylase family 4
MGMIKPKEGPCCEACPLYESGIPVADHMPHDFLGLSLIGEMPGRQEVQFQSCFIGPSGRLLDAALEVNSLTRDTIHISNVIRCGLPRGAKPGEKEQEAAAKCCKPLLHNNLEYIGTKVACAIGAVPWKAMTGLAGIDKYRGTVIAAQDVPWHTTGTVHPAGLMRVEARRLRVDQLIDDLFKAQKLATGDIHLWDPVVKDPNDFDGLMRFLTMLREGPVACDVETDGIDASRCNLLTIGIAAKNRKTGKIEAWPIPYHPNFPGFYTEEQWDQIQEQLVNIFVDDSSLLVFHNMPYDVPVLERHFDLEISADCHDTLLLHHATYPKLPHKLQEVASQFLCVEPWKDQFRSSEKDLEKITKELDKGVAVHVDFANGTVEGIDGSETDDIEEDEYNVIIKDIDQLSEMEVGELLWYNGCDCVATLELYHILTEEARALDVYKVYEADRELLRYTIDWYYAGVAIDEAQRAKFEVEYAKDLNKLLKALRALCKLPKLKEITRKVKPLEKQVEKLSFELKQIRLECAFCHYIAKSGPDQCKHIVKKHFGEAAEIADERQVKWRGEVNPKEQSAIVLQAVKDWHQEDLKAQQAEIKKTKAEIKAILKHPCQDTFNPGSPPQLREALRQRGLTPTKLTKKSNELSTSKDSLWELRDDEFIDILFKYRKKAKLYSTYIVGLPNKLGPDGRLHPVWKLHATPSGRFGTQPAIQNWPEDMRVLIVPDPGHVIIGADFDGKELRISALLSGQQDLIDAFMTNADIHAKHAGIFFPSIWPQLNKEWEESADNDQERDNKVPARKKIRNRGKNVTFGKIYRAGPKTLYEQIREKLDDVRTKEEHQKLKAEVAAMSAALDNAYPNIPEWAESMAALAEETLGLRTALSGRLRKWPMGEVPPTEAANHPIQGLAADIMNQATIRLIERLKEEGLYRNGVWIIMQIHDAIYLEVEEQHAVKVAKIVEETLATELTLLSIVTGMEHRMVFPAEAEIGYNAKELMSVEKWKDSHGRRK